MRKRTGRKETVSKKNDIGCTKLVIGRVLPPETDSVKSR
jgi:hypothetical protein